MPGGWPADWADLISGAGCPMCVSPRPDEDEYGVLIHATGHTRAQLQRAPVQRGYALVIWTGRHVVEPYELDADEAAAYWHDVLAVARALAGHYRPLKMNYETLGNSVPHLHTHLVPRYVEDPAPGRPYPLVPPDGAPPVDPEQLRADAAAIRALLEPPGR